MLALSHSPRHPLAGGHIGFQTFGCGDHEVAEVPARDVLGRCLLDWQDESLVGIHICLDRDFFVKSGPQEGECVREGGSLRVLGGRVVHRVVSVPLTTSLRNHVLDKVISLQHGWWHLPHPLQPKCHQAILHGLGPVNQLITDPKVTSGLISGQSPRFLRRWDQFNVSLS